MPIFTDIETMAITGTQLAGFRKDLGMTQEELAKDLDIPRSTLVDWERRKEKEIPVRAYSKFRIYCKKNFKVDIVSQKIEDASGIPVGVAAGSVIGYFLGGPVGAAIGGFLGLAGGAASDPSITATIDTNCPRCKEFVIIPNLKDCTYECPYCQQLFKFRSGGPVITAGKVE